MSSSVFYVGFVPFTLANVDIFMCHATNDLRVACIYHYQCIVEVIKYLAHLKNVVEVFLADA